MVMEVIPSVDILEDRISVDTPVDRISVDSQEDKTLEDTPAEETLEVNPEDTSAEETSEVILVVETWEDTLAEDSQAASEVTRASEVAMRDTMAAARFLEDMRVDTRPAVDTPTMEALSEVILRVMRSCTNRVMPSPSATTSR